MAGALEKITAAAGITLAAATGASANPYLVCTGAPTVAQRLADYAQHGGAVPGNRVGAPRQVFHAVANGRPFSYIITGYGTNLITGGAARPTVTGDPRSHDSHRPMPGFSRSLGICP